MKTSKILMSCAIIILTGFSSCSIEDDVISGDCFGGTWIQELSVELQTWTATAQAYSDEPTKENCNRYKSAIANYLDALERIKKCVPVISKGDFDESLKEAKLELNEIEC